MEEILLSPMTKAPTPVFYQLGIVQRNYLIKRYFHNCNYKRIVRLIVIDPNDIHTMMRNQFLPLETDLYPNFARLGKCCLTLWCLTLG